MAAFVAVHRDRCAQHARDRDEGDLLRTLYKELRQRYALELVGRTKDIR